MPAIHWHEIPFVRICLPFIVGILFQQYIGDFTPVLYGILITGVVILLSFLCKSYHYKQLIRTAAVCLLLFSAGGFVRYNAEPSQSEINRLASSNLLLVSRVQSVIRSDYGLKAQLHILKPSTSVDNIKIVAYVRDSSMTLLPADTVIFQSDIELIPSPGNPYAFDIGKYYRNQGIHLRTYLDSAQIKAIRKYQGNLNLARKSAEIREHIKLIFHKYVPNPQSSAVLLAMTIGIVEGLSDDIYDAYAKTGTIHVLSISGLHVGIISVLLFLIVGRVRASDKTGIKALRVGMLLAGIWSFAFIAGLSPSIVRASLMFSVYMAGISLRRPARGLNVMTFTAFLCLSIDPFQINSLSFQFSYLALCGLLIFFKPLYQLVAVKSFAAKFIWSTVVMSVAAQVLLLPLLIHYFQQISLISLLSSLVAIPASYVILFGGILLLVLHHIVPIAADFAGNMMSHFVEIVNQSIIGMSHLPLSHLTNVYLPLVEILLLSGITLLIALRTLTSGRYWTYGTVPAAVILAVLHVMTIQETSRQQKLAIYPHPEKIAIDFIDDAQCYTTFDSRSMSRYQAQEVHTFRNAARVRGAEQVLPLPDDTSGIHVLELSVKSGQPYDSAGCRIAMITGNVSIDSISLQKLKADWIILSNTLQYKARQSYRQFLTDHNQRFHDLREHGAFYLTQLKNNTTHEKQRQNNSG